MNQLLTAFLPPRRLPKLDLERAGRARRVPHGRRRTHALRQRGGRARSAGEPRGAVSSPTARRICISRILSDFTDAPTETCRDDAAIVAAAVEGMQALNARVRRGRRGRVLPLSSRRGGGIRSQGVWMGWERKRGKLAEFNRFLAAADAGAVLRHRGRRRRRCAKVRYVITLDADTVLPPTPRRC